MTDKNYSSESEDTQVTPLWGRDVQAKITKKYGDPNKEVWTKVRGFEGYYKVSNLGRVKNSRGRIRKTTLVRRGKGYTQLDLWKGGIVVWKRVYHLVLEGFVGFRPAGTQCCHVDGDSRNDRLDNLRWDTAKSNQADRVLHGTDLRGVDQHLAKLDDGKVRMARKLYDSGKLTVNRLAEKFGVHRKTMWQVVKRVTWKHIK